jgi:hypothetical protein
MTNWPPVSPRTARAAAHRRRRVCMSFLCSSPGPPASSHRSRAGRTWHCRCCSDR